MIYVVQIACKIEFWLGSFLKTYFTSASIGYIRYLSISSVHAYRYSSPSKLIPFDGSIFFCLIFSSGIFLVLQALSLMFFTSCQDLFSRIAVNIATDWIELEGVIWSTATADSTSGWLFWTRILGFASVISELSWGTKFVSAFDSTNFAKSVFADVKIIFILVFFVVQTFFVGAKCRSFAILIMYTFITSPLCLGVSFPIYCTLAFCQQGISDFIFKYMVL